MPDGDRTRRSGPASGVCGQLRLSPRTRRTCFSTRGAGPATFAQALHAGLAPDGGLYLPRPLPRLTWPYGGETFGETAASVAEALFDGLLPSGLARRAAETAIDFPAPLVEIDPDTWVLELFHGPSCAFKDVGARFMAETMDALGAPGAEWSFSRESPASFSRESAATVGAGTSRTAAVERTILVATSGDTGGAVASAFSGRKGCEVVPIFPSGGISERQRRQMTTLGGNVTAVAVEGSFDDCQVLVKSALADAELSARHRLTSANSINLGRLLPQVFYYVHAANLLMCRGGRPPRFVVPSGNLGNLCAGLLAHLAGVPMAGLVAACNANDAFVRFMVDGTASEVKNAEANLRRSVSSAMDVARPSNLERIRALFPDMAELNSLVSAVSIGDPETTECLAMVRREAGYLMDPHTAVGVCAHRMLPAEKGTPTVILATAHPAKFPEVVALATGTQPELPPSLASALERDEALVEIGPDLDALIGVLELVRGDRR